MVTNMEENQILKRRKKEKNRLKDDIVSSKS